MPQEARILNFSDFAESTTKLSQKAQKPRKSSNKHKSGLYRLHFRYQDPITGAACEKDVYGTTKTEAERKKKDFLRKVEQGLRVAQNGHTVAQWADEWLETYKRPYVKETTLAMYEKEVKIIKQAMGARPLSAVLQSDIQRLMETRSGMSASTIHKTHLTVNAMMQAAADNRLIPFNPCKGVIVPGGSAGTHRALTRDEVKLMLSVVANGHRLSLIVMLMLFAGLRRGEAVGLRPEDVSEDGIHVSRAVYWINNRPKIGSPKSKAGVRTVPVFPPLKPYIDAFIAQPQPEEPLTLSSFARAFQSFLYACEEKLNGCSKRWMPSGAEWKTVDIRTHDLRHTFASMLYDANVDVKTAQKWLGHSDPAITLKIYTHLSKERAVMSKEVATKYIEEAYK